MGTLNHPHPGMAIRYDVIKPLGLTVRAAAAKFGVLPAVLVPVLKGRAPITAELAQGLELAGVSTARFWLALQSEYDARHGF